MKYLAIGAAQRHRRFITPGAMPLYRRLIVEGAWWDLVDGVASDLVGTVLLDHRAATTPVLRRWLHHDDLWLRRSAIISQLNHKTATDAAFLFECCSARAHETEFFMRKAIGWALRQYARTDPEAVRRFVAEQGDKLSGLSRREALKHL
jgi:3-methyladenine DNA glycosylase AlkD